MKLEQQMKLAGDEVNQLVREIEQIEANVRMVWNDRLCRDVPKYTKAAEARLANLRSSLKAARDTQDALMHAGIR